ncbi:unnamed protein product [marine sediment metagenome]|uniref:Uncharacterized protein n=1 Tax=marine sediment metagenome TaxID=412755 RepID=X1KND2_9ZZZZ
MIKEENQMDRLTLLFALLITLGTAVVSSTVSPEAANTILLWAIFWTLIGKEKA